MRRAALSLPLVLAACAAPRAVEPAPSAPPPAPAPQRHALDADWDTSGAWTFERRVAALERAEWSAPDRATLVAALAAQDLRSVRAAVLLAHGGDASREQLLQRLEARVRGPLRESDAADMIAATALGVMGGADTAARLAALGAGPAPHPDLEVRVECAAVALDAGRDDGIDFLLRVLTADTPAEREHPIDWVPEDRLAWAKYRAAGALARRAGVPDTFRPDGSFEHQVRTAEALRALLPAD
ncbi:MAG: hypothetical protein H6828_09805 [Planctomycetes bacterium]|nr:hypothetical protein [Planctomycetota bacterium]